MLGVVIAMERSRRRARRAQLRARWRELPDRYTESKTFRRIVARAADDLPRLESTIAKLEEMACESGE